ILVMGPWHHGAWLRSDGAQLGHAWFGGPTSPHYQEHIQKPFFDAFLIGDGESDCALPGAIVFETGLNRWRDFAAWPPEEVETRYLYLGDDSRLAISDVGSEISDFKSEISDPGSPF